MIHWNSLLIAFGMYSKIPIPMTEWKEEDMKYAICFFPLIGIILGSVFSLSAWILRYFGFGGIFRASILTIIPLYLTGGIHMDGYCDTCDALSSYQSMEKKLEILKDPHTGAFAIIRACMYVIFYFGCISALSMNGIIVLSFGFVVSRALSGMSVVRFRTAKKNGLLASFHDTAHKTKVTLAMCFYLFISIIFMLFLSPLRTVAVVLAAVVTFIHYRYISYKEFGGTTGDLAGYFLQRCELAMCLFLALAEGVIM